ncbi:Hsp20/alpha crystallin family protein [Cooperia oncophora]
MSLCTFPMILPRLIDDAFLELDDIDRALRAHARRDSKAIGQLDKVVDDDSKLAISLNVEGFKPDDLNMTLEDRVLTVEGKQEVKEEHGYALRSFVRQWTLPKDVNVDELKSSMTEQGHLSIEAPKVKRQPAVTTKTIPIHKAVKDHKAEKEQ